MADILVPPGAFDAHCQNPVRMLSFKTLFRILLVLIVPTLLALGAIDQPLRVPGNPHGIVSFEFCGWTGSCEATLQAWGEHGRQWAMLSLGLDYLFMLEYTGLVWLGLQLLAQRVAQPAVQQPPNRLLGVLRGSAVLALLAGVFDAAENLCLIGVVHSGQGAPLAGWAAGFASVKFVMIGVALIVLLVGWWRVNKQN